MDNKNFYIAIKDTIDYYKKEQKSSAGFYLIKAEFKDLQEKDFDEYHEDVDYRKIFLRSYYRRYLDTSPSLDFDGKELNWQSRFVAQILFGSLKRQFRDRPDEMMALSKYYNDSDISESEYQALLEEHGLL